jgi:pentatricopeptide repeat protein
MVHWLNFCQLLYCYSLESSINELLLPSSVAERIEVPEGLSSLPITGEEAESVVQRLRSMNRKINTPMVDTAVVTTIDETNSHAAIVAFDTDRGGQSVLDSRSSADAKRANCALLHFCKVGNFQAAKEAYELMKSLRLDIASSVYPVYMKAGTKARKYADVDAVFDGLVLSNDSLSPAPSIYVWTAKVVNTAQAGKPDEALKIVNQLVKTGAPLSVRMFNSILASFVRLGNFKDAYQVWERMHEEPGVELDTFSFAIMIKYCLLTQQPEKAFFYMDELRSIGLKPDLMTFQNLFAACATAPFWVNGYQDIIFEAMCLMEGAELLPNVEIYNSIIFAFSRAGDAVSAEYYFWELIRKGLKPDIATFEYLMGAYAESQSVGASRYGKQGRYVKSEARPLSEDQKVYQDLGAETVASASK